MKAAKLEGFSELWPITAFATFDFHHLACGTDCKAFQMLKDAIEGTVTY